ncbi:MAG: ribosomal protein S18-alanine N-acetyltransferase [Proteobacteria bacterium]|nr:ribosomal protein S18-alanine N-acetyltransferase [Pseudomonadota bacterium]
MIQFSPVRRNEIEALILREASATPYPWTARNLNDSVDASADCRLIKHKGKTIGYCVVQSVLDEAELLNIVVFKPYQLRGFGTKIIQKLKAELAQSGMINIFLEVRASNLIAKALYEKTDFEVVDIRQKYYRAGNQVKEDALLMRCSLS